MHEEYIIPDDRELTSEERRILEWLVYTVSKNVGKHGKKVEEFADQLQTVKVVARCGCGCQTRYLGFPGEKEPRFGLVDVCIDAEGDSPEGIEIYVNLHVIELKLAILEILAKDGSNISFPRLEDLREW